MKYFLYIIISVALISCNTQKISTENNNAENLDKNIFFNKISKSLSYKQIKISGNLEVSIPGKTIPTIGVTIYNEKNTKVWINGTVLFLNMVRGLATPEQFQAYEKVNKTYVESNYNYLNDLLGINFIDYKALEKLLLGEIFMPLEANEFKLNVVDNQYIIESLKETIITANGKDYSYSQKYTFDANFNLINATIEDKKKPMLFNISYENRKVINKLNLPQKVKIFIKDTKSKEISLEYTNFGFESMDTHYRVPSNYKLRTIK